MGYKGYGIRGVREPSNGDTSLGLQYMLNIVHRYDFLRTAEVPPRRFQFTGVLVPALRKHEGQDKLGTKKYIFFIGHTIRLI